MHAQRLFPPTSPTPTVDPAPAPAPAPAIVTVLASAEGRERSRLAGNEQVWLDAFELTNKWVTVPQLLRAAARPVGVRTADACQNAPSMSSTSPAMTAATSKRIWRGRTGLVSSHLAASWRMRARFS